MDPASFEGQLSFCGDVVTYRACLPRENSMFPAHNAMAKDAWVRTKVTGIIAQRIALENDERLKDLGASARGSAKRCEGTEAGAVRVEGCWAPVLA